MRHSWSAPVASTVAVTVCAVAPALGQTPPVPGALPPKVVQAMLERRAPRQFVDGDVIVKFKAAAGAPAVTPQATLDRFRLGPRLRTLSGGAALYRLVPPSTLTAGNRKAYRKSTIQTIAELRASGEVEYAQPNFIHKLAVDADDRLYGRQWSLRDNGTEVGRSPGGISAAKAAADGSLGDPSVVVAVIDTGILATHEDIQGSPNLADGYDMITDASRANDGDGRDDDPTDPGDGVAQGECGDGNPAVPSSWHGTHVAGIVGVVRTGNGIGIAALNRQGRVQAVRVLGKCGGTTSDINDAIRWAAGLPVPNAPNNRTPAKVLNLSFRAFAPCSESPSTQAAIDDAVGAGATVVVAAGNDAVDAREVFPAGCRNVIAVAASDARGRLVQRYSNFGPAIAILAPGGDVRRDDNGDGYPDGILSTVLGGYEYYNGTSMASPHVAGVAALLLAREDLSPIQVRERLRSNALPRTAEQCPKPCGAGLLSAAAVTNLEVSPSKVSLGRAGRTATVQIKVTERGQPLAGKTVSLGSIDSGVATAEPTSAVTDTEGHTVATVTATGDGETTLDSRVGDARRETPVKVPGFSGPLAFVVAAVMAFVVRRVRPGQGPR